MEGQQLQLAMSTIRGELFLGIKLSIIYVFKNIREPVLAKDDCRCMMPLRLKVFVGRSNVYEHVLANALSDVHSICTTNAILRTSMKIGPVKK